MEHVVYRFELVFWYIILIVVAVGITWGLSHLDLWIPFVKAYVARWFL